jgi:hypothetical protein
LAARLPAWESQEQEPSIPAPLASGWSSCRAGLTPVESANLSRRALTRAIRPSLQRTPASAGSPGPLAPYPCPSTAGFWTKPGHVRPEQRINPLDSGPRIHFTSNSDYTESDTSLHLTPRQSSVTDAFVVLREPKQAESVRVQSLFERDDSTWLIRATWHGNPSPIS